MRFVKTARGRDCHNLHPVQHKKKIYYKTIKVSLNTEVRVIMSMCSKCNNTSLILFKYLAGSYVALLPPFPLSFRPTYIVAWLQNWRSVERWGLINFFPNLPVSTQVMHMSLLCYEALINFNSVSAAHQLVAVKTNTEYSGHTAGPITRPAWYCFQVLWQGHSYPSPATLNHSFCCQLKPQFLSYRILCPVSSNPLHSRLKLVLCQL